ncbi:DUF3040 domain-containing protein [Kitasatospora sp. NBC_01287]|uniref:DUF3040 domain-containing protein n=1 Tax=Kitasatospora sp. NBC_01287 TaxID=2903573 RepID=UPI00224F5461|nr:DUF3040 domain-containing protein [Kitasatospora sp. NBC_01287]MCX4750830.1 DUF3040 domain-containing protein [Kitasatospora sp. NBC_01287]
MVLSRQEARESRRIETRLVAEDPVLERRFEQWRRSRDRVAEAAALAAGRTPAPDPTGPPPRLRRLWHEILRGRIPLP